MQKATACTTVASISLPGIPCAGLGSALSLALFMADARPLNLQQAACMPDLQLPRSIAQQ